MTDVVADFAREVRELCSFFERTAAPALAPIHTSAPDLRAAQGMQEAQEAQIRKYLIDTLLAALGWNLSDPRVMLIEEKVPPLPSSETISAGKSRFIDYHGRETGPGIQAKSLLLIEAKRLFVNLPNPQSAGFLDHSKLFAESLNKRLMQREVPTGVSQQWSEWLDSIVDYVRRVKAAYGHAPTCAGITNGNWYVVFLDCETSLISGPASTAQVLVFHDLTDVLHRAHSFWSVLAYDNLRAALASQHPSQIHKFAAHGERLACTVAARVEYKAMGWRQPLLAVHISAWVKTTSRGWLLFQMELGDDFIPWRSSKDDLEPILAELARRRDLLLAELRKHVILDFVAPETTASRTSIEKLTIKPAVTPEHLVSLTTDGHYLLTVGEHVAHVTQDTKYDTCPYHAHGPCHRDGVATLHGPILKSAVSPPAFFPSGSPYHCAHRSVHQQREEKCLIGQFETFLCCRRCAFFNYCWPDGGSTLPCTRT